jgi:hypothetical protein
MNECMQTIPTIGIEVLVCVRSHIEREVRHLPIGDLLSQGLALS